MSNYMPYLSAQEQRHMAEYEQHRRDVYFDAACKQGEAKSKKQKSDAIHSLDLLIRDGGQSVQSDGGVVQEMQWLAKEKKIELECEMKQIENDDQPTYFFGF